MTIRANDLNRLVAVLLVDLHGVGGYSYVEYVSIHVAHSSVNLFCTVCTAIKLTV